MQYECLLSGLPELHTGMPAPFPLSELRQLLLETLSPADAEQLRLLDRHATYGACPFIREWLAFNQALNNVLTADICRRHQLDPSLYLVGDIPDEVDPQILEITHVENLYERERQIDAVRFQWLEERTRMVFFSLENVLAYYLMTAMLCRWSILNRETGEQVFRDLVADMKKGVHFE